MTGSLPVHQYYSAETSPRGFLYHAFRVGNLLRVVAQHRVLTRYFVSRDLMSRFHGSVIGIGWVLVHPMFMFAVYYFVFGALMGRGQGSSALHFALYLFTGLFCFHSMTGGVGGALGSIVGSGALVKKVAFPAELLPIVPILVEMVVMLVGLSIGVLFGVVTGELQPGWEFLLFPWFLLDLIVFSIGLGLFLANLEVFWRDVRQIWQIVALAWFFVSPNFMTPDFFEEHVPAVLQPIVKANPMYHLLIGERQVFGFRDESLALSGTVVQNLAIGSAWAIGLLVVGYGTFMANKRQYADLV